MLLQDVLPYKVLRSGRYVYGSAASIEKSVKAMLDDAYANGEKTGYIANLGHGITQWVDPARPKIFVDTVHEYSAKYLG